MAESKEELKSLLMMVKDESERAGLKLNIKKKLRSWCPVPLLHGKQKGKGGSSDRFPLLGLQNQLDAMILVFVCCFKPAFSLSSFTFIKRKDNKCKGPEVRACLIYLRNREPRLGWIDKILKYHGNTRCREGLQVFL